MNPSQIGIAQFFQPVIQLPTSAIHSSYAAVSSFFTVNSNSTCNTIVLKDSILLVSTQQDRQITHGVVLEEGVRFRPIRQEGRLKGFRLINGMNKYVDIMVPFEGLAQIWVEQLGKILSQVGFNEEFQVLRKIGRGSTACVYEVRRFHDHKLFAAKVVLKSYLQQRKERAQSLAQQIELLRSLQHPNIIRLQGVFECEQAVYLLFERLSGGNLMERLNRQRGLTLGQVRTVMRGVAEGLAYLHRFDIAHRDLKLENILLRDQNSLQPVIADFGLAVLAEQEPYLYYRCGTPGYVAPEIIRMRRKRPVTVACDIFSAGAILHVLLTNTYLFPGETADEVYRLNRQSRVQLTGDSYDRLEPAAFRLLRKMLKVRASHRISAQEMLEQEFLQEQQQQQKEEVSPAATEAGEAYPF